MNEQDKLFEMLDQHLSGYEPPLPDNDWDNFRHKLRGKGNNNRFWYRLGIYPLIVLLLILNLPLLIQVKDKIFVSQNENQLDIKASASQIITPVRKEAGVTSTQQIFNSTNEQTNSTVAVNSDKTQKHGINKSKGYTKQKTELDKYGNNSKAIQEAIKQPIKQNNDFELIQPIENDKISLPKQQNDESKKEVDKPLPPDDLIMPLKQPPEVTQNKTDSTLPELPITIIHQKNKGAIYFRVVFSADYTSAEYEIAGSYTNKVHEDYSLLRKDAEKDGWGYSVGVNLEYFIRPRISLSSGIFFDDNRISGKYNFYNNKIPVFDSISGDIIGYVPGNDTIGTHTAFTNNYRYLEIPLIFNYSIWEKKNLVMGVRAGVDGFFLLNVKGSTLDKSDLSVIPVNSNDYKGFDWGSIAGINIRYKINDRFILGIEPVWKKYWGSVYKEEVMVVSKPSTFAINASFLIKIK